MLLGGKVAVPAAVVASEEAKPGKCQNLLSPPHHFVTASDLLDRELVPLFSLARADKRLCDLHAR